MGQYSSKGALFIDLDGTVFIHSTNKPINSSVSAIRLFKEEGYKIIFTTYRGEDNFPGHEIYGKDNTLNILKELNIPYDEIIFDLPSPRILVNDDGIGGLRIKTNEGFLYSELQEAIENSK